MWARGDRGSRDVAVIDVGSNSVRLVLYRVEGRAIWTVFNEKVLAGLGRRLAETGRLSPEGMRIALFALRRFRAVLDGAQPSEVFTAATAAVRDAADGPEFVERVRDETGLKIRILSGEEEARYSALGVIAGQPEADGVAGDLGGSSLELISVGGGRAGTGVTLPLGPFALGAPAAIDASASRLQVAEQLSSVGAAFQGRCFYAVGGAWRNLALIHMDAVGYPLRIVHAYEMNAREALDVARFVAQQSKTSLEQIPGVSRKRAETLPYAALVLEGLVQQLGLERVSMSAFGLREGLILEAMPKAVRRLDPLVAGCAALGARPAGAERLGSALQAWLHAFWTALDPVFSTERGDVLLAAACRLADLGAHLHPDHRADLAFDQVLRAPIAGQTHAERAFLAVAMFARHTSHPAARKVLVVDRVLSPERMLRARILGAAMRLGCDVSGRTPALLDGCDLEFENHVLVLTVKRASADLLLGEQTRKRLQSLASLVAAESRIRTV